MPLSTIATKSQFTQLISPRQRMAQTDPRSTGIRALELVGATAMVFLFVVAAILA